MVFTAGSPGTGTFTLPLLSATGTNNVLGVTNIALLSSANCGTTLSSTYTFANNTTPILSAGVSFSACAYAGSPVSITASSSASYYSALAWSTSNGTGTFSSNTTGSALTSTTYNPTAADITRGFAYMTLTATANTGCTDGQCSWWIGILQPDHHLQYAAISFDRFRIHRLHHKLAKIL
jgi:hypothetical protein